jgi:hypothetical protein
MKGIVVETNEMLFDQLMALRDAKTPEHINREVKRAHAMSMVATNIAKNIDVTVKATELLGRMNSSVEQTLADAVGEADYTGPGVESNIQKRIRIPEQGDPCVDGATERGNQ